MSTTISVPSGLVSNPAFQVVEHALPVTRVLVVSANESWRRDRLAELAGPQLASQAVGMGEPLGPWDVMLLDVEVSEGDAAEGLLDQASQSLGSEQAYGMITLMPGLAEPMAIGECLSLPDDVSPRELRTACLMLGEVVRIRRALAIAGASQAELRVAAETDPLTGVANRRAWDEELAWQIERAMNERRPLCVAIVDLDHFKQANDRLGHASADVLLKNAAHALRTAVRQSDFVARLGGDEFGLLVDGLDYDAAQQVIERARRSVGLPLGDSGDWLRASAGFCVWRPAQEGDVSALVGRLFGVADAALYRAKEVGRNRTAGRVVG
jgi:diguanylate cyclase (GGDEF)-like protein